LGAPWVLKEKKEEKGGYAVPPIGGTKPMNYQKRGTFSATKERKNGEKKKKLAGKKKGRGVDLLTEKVRRTGRGRKKHTSKNLDPETERFVLPGSKGRCK